MIGFQVTGLSGGERGPAREQGGADDKTTKMRKQILGRPRLFYRKIPLPGIFAPMRGLFGTTTVGSPRHC